MSMCITKFNGEDFIATSCCSTKSQVLHPFPPAPPPLTIKPTNVCEISRFCCIFGSCLQIALKHATILLNYKALFPALLTSFIS